MRSIENIAIAAGNSTRHNSTVMQVYFIHQPTFRTGTTLQISKTKTTVHISDLERDEQTIYNFCGTRSIFEII